MNWRPCGFNDKTLVIELHGCIHWIQPNQAGRNRSRKNFIRYQSRHLLLQSNIVRTQERRRHVSKANEQDVLMSDWEECASSRGWHVGKGILKDDLKETFNTLHFYNMKLNPNKCAFGVMVGKTCIFHSHCQCGLSQRGGWSTKTCIFHKPSTPRCKRKVPSNGKASLRFSDHDL